MGHAGRLCILHSRNHFLAVRESCQRLPKFFDRRMFHGELACRPLPALPTLGSLGVQRHRVMTSVENPDVIHFGEIVILGG